MFNLSAISVFRLAVRFRSAMIVKLRCTVRSDKKRLGEMKMYSKRDTAKYRC